MKQILYLHIYVFCIVEICGQHPKPIVKLVRGNGYPFEEHANIQTPDGYLLTLFRIPHGKHVLNFKKREPVLLMHGIFGSGEHFVASGPKKGLGFLLADRGYDVWLGNVRSTSHSQHHVTLNPDTDKAFWNFSMTELGVYDVSTKIDYILNKTRRQKLTYIGHSQGNMIFFILCSELPQYNEKIKLFVALSPTAYIAHMTHPWFTKLARLQRKLEVVTTVLGIYELLPGRWLINLLGPFFCSLPLISDFCEAAFFFAAGINVPQFVKSYIPEITKTSPEGVGTKQLYHVFQLINEDKFQKYDYGKSKNLLIYNSTSPPNFNTSNTKIPAALFYGQNDWFLDVGGEMRIRNELPNVILNYEINNTYFSHIDFLWAKDVIPLLYSRVFNVMDTFRNLP